MLTLIDIQDIRSLDLIISVMGYLVVLVALLLLNLFFLYLPKLVYMRWKKPSLPGIRSKPVDSGTEITGEEVAAIAMALHLYFEIHDEESGMLTIQRISKPYSPWSSKIYAVRNQFNRI